MTQTYTTYFDPKEVDDSVGAAYKKLEADFEKRRPYLDHNTVRKIEARLSFLRACWTLLLDRVGE